MIVICEECGKKYRIDPGKIKGESAKFRCKSCNHVITVSKPAAVAPEPPPPVTPPPPEAARARPPVPEAARDRAPVTEPEARKKPAKVKKVRRGVGLRTKMAVLFFLIPIVLMVASGLLYLRQLNNLSALITGESSTIVKQLAEKAIRENARSVASQTMLYILTNPELRKQDYDRNVDLKRVAVQKVGLTGYSALYELPGPDGIWRTWAHANSKIIGIDMSKLKEPLGKAFPGFWRVYTGVKGGREASGYYTWQDKDGTFRDKYMVCTPVEGTKFIIASTTYLDEFTLPIVNMEKRAEKIRIDVRNINIAILGGALILVGLVVSLYGRKLSKRIRSLTDVAERISVGELDAEVEIKTKDEIGDLGEAITRMQESIRLSIDRLRRRR